MMKFLRILWQKIRGRPDGAGRSRKIEKQWSSDRGTLLQIRRSSPGAIATYKFNLLGSSQDLLLLCDELPPIRDWLRRDGLFRRLRIPREFESGVLAALNEPSQTHVILVGWQSKSLIGGRHAYRPLGVFSVDLSSVYPPCDRPAIRRVALHLWELEIKGDLWEEIVTRINFGLLISAKFRAFTQFDINLKKHL